MKYQRVITLICFVFTFYIAKSAHIVGGDAIYTCISSDQVNQTTTFRINYTIYRDAAGAGAQFDNPAYFGLYKKSSATGNWDYQRTFQIQVMNVTQVPYDDECVTVPPQIRVEKAEYESEVTLDWGDEAYQITYQRCCRNNTINNIVDPASTGAVYSVEISPFAVRNCNNSPKFKNFPPVLICNNRPIDFDHSAIDSDGDYISYEFCNPLTSGGTDGATTPGDPTSCTGVTPNPMNCPPPYDLVDFLSPLYSFNTPMAGNPVVNIDATTGLISGIPNIIGQYVVGVCAKEYRNGVLIGEIRRDFQFNVAECGGIVDSVRYEICEGDSISVNDINYFEQGMYIQSFVGSNGCDSTLFVNLNTIKTTQNIQSFDLCIGDTLQYNNENYTEAGQYSTTLQGSQGCDSLISIVINGMVPTSSNMVRNLCNGATLDINGISYATSGTYTQTMLNAAGCDSILTIVINSLSATESILNYKLCEEDFVELNGQTYALPGSYTQLLVNTEGCDSTIYIEVQKSNASETFLKFSLCETNPVTYLGVDYENAGRYQIELQSDFGCDSTIILDILECRESIHYDLEDCDALVPMNGTVYTEFTPVYIDGLACGNVNASIIYRNEPDSNKHSCTPGYLGGAAMCIGASLSCNDEDVQITPLTITFDVQPDASTDTLNPEVITTIVVNSFSFFHKGPDMFDWIAGPKGPTNFPTKYSVRIYKDDVLVLEQKDLPTQNDWAEKKYFFYENDVFEVDTFTTFRIELLPYCPIGNSEMISVWDIDDVRINLSCFDRVDRELSGRIVNYDASLAGTKVVRTHGNVKEEKTLDANGEFKFGNTRQDRQYTIEMVNSHTSSITEGVTSEDIDRIKEHMLGLKLFDFPYQYIAADINNDGRISPADFVELRQVILKNKTSFTNNYSWRFFDNDLIQNTHLPLELEDSIIIKPSTQKNRFLEIKAIKIGDLRD